MAAPSVGQRYSNRSNPDYRVRYRSLELNVENMTNFRLEFMGDYFESGLWHDNPGHHIVEPQSKQRYIVTSKMGGFLVGVTGAVKYSVVGEGCFLYICFSAPVAGAYKTKVALHRTDHPAGTEYTNLQADRYTAVKYKDMVASAEMLDSGVGCKMQYLYRLAIQQNMEPPILPPGPPVQDAGPFKDLSSAQPSKDSEAVEIPSLPKQPAVTPPPPPPALPPPAPPAPSPNVAASSTNLPTRHSQPNLHESIQSQILDGVKLKSVSASPAKGKIAEKRSIEEILSSAIDQRRSMMDSDSE